jgi:hypothetical protein
MWIIGVAIALLLVASSAYVVVSAIRGPEVAPAVTLPRPLINRPQSVRSEPNAWDRDHLRKYFLQGLPDGRGRALP